MSILLCNRPFHYAGILSLNTIEKWLSAATQSLIGRLQRAEILSIARNSTFFADSGVGVLVQRLFEAAAGLHLEGNAFPFGVKLSGTCCRHGGNIQF